MKRLFIFLAGAVVGSLVTYKFVEEKYKKIADEEIESVKEVFNKRMDELNNKHKEQTEEVVEKTVKDVYGESMEKLGYAIGVDVADEDVTDQQVENFREHSVPYEIEEEEYGMTDNDEKTLFYYADFTLADEDDEIISDPEELVGDSLGRFSDPLVERVYVRNDNDETDYLILRSEKSYSEIYGKEE